MASSDYLEGYGYNSSEAAQAALLESDDNVDMFYRTCGTRLIVEELQEGEAVCTPIRVLCTLVTVSVISAWFNRRVSIRNKLLLFFSHWLRWDTYVCFVCYTGWLMMSGGVTWLPQRIICIATHTRMLLLCRSERRTAYRCPQQAR